MAWPMALGIVPRPSSPSHRPPASNPMAPAVITTCNAIAPRKLATTRIVAAVAAPNERKKITPPPARANSQAVSATGWASQPVIPRGKNSAAMLCLRSAILDQVTVIPAPGLQWRGQYMTKRSKSLGCQTAGGNKSTFAHAGSLVELPPISVKCPGIGKHQA